MTTPPNKTNQWVVGLLVIGVLWLIGTLFGGSDSTDDMPTGDTSSYVDDTGLDQDTQRAALQVALDQYNATADMTICQAVSVLGRTQAVDTVMKGSDYMFDREVVSDFLLDECP